MNAWIFQDTKQVTKLGAKAASWYVGWYDPNGRRRCKSCGPGANGKKAAFHLQRKIEAEMLEGTYRPRQSISWDEFRRKFRETIWPTLAPENARIAEEVLDKFERIVKPARMSHVNAENVDFYVAKRIQERGRNKGSLISPATLNKELRHLKAVFGYAADWDLITAVPRIRMRDEPEKLAVFVTPEHFTAIYNACNSAERPRLPHCTPAEWWQALLTMAVMTGWRVSELLAVQRADVDVIAKTALTRHGDNKGNRDDLTPLHEVVLEHLAAVKGFERQLFPWPHNRESLWTEFKRIQKAAKIHLNCQQHHEHTPSCHLYGFHDLRRAFATQNASKLTAATLQALMRHRSYTTTQKYINMASQLKPSAAELHVPDILKKAE